VFLDGWVPRKFEPVTTFAELGFDILRAMAEAFAALFEKARLGDGIARDALYRLAFFRLRAIASGLLRRERPGHTLQPTALVSELFLKLRRLDTAILSDDHFFRISARAMRQVLIDHSRHKRPLKMVPADLIPELLQPENQKAIDPESALAVKMVFEKLRAMDAKVAETVWLRAVEGVTIQELSERQGREAWRVRADHDFGLQWMSNRLKRYC
jgi:RNA polymerase sigma-70 factor, ECF subfamily